LKFIPRFIQAFLVACFVLIPVSVTAQQQFTIAEFDEIATRAEGAIESGRASSASLEALRVTLSAARSSALEAQAEHTARVKTLQDQLNALGALPSEGNTEAIDIATRRKQLDEQLSAATGPLLTAQESYERADGLISEIDTTIRSRNTAELVKREASPLNPAEWGPAATSLSAYLVKVSDETKAAFSSASSVALLKQKLPLVLILIALGVLFLFPVYHWTGRKMTELASRPNSVVRNIKRLVLSILVFLVPVVGFSLLVESITFLDIAGLRGAFLLDALPNASVAIFGANWLARNLFETAGDPSTVLDQHQRRLKGAYKFTLLLGVVLALDALLTAFAQSGEFDLVSLGVLRFPMILLGGYALIMMGRKVQSYRTSMSPEENSPLVDRSTLILMYLCSIAGVLGPVAAGIGYFNIADMLVISTILTLAVFATLYIFYALTAAFVEDSVPVTLDDGTEVQSSKAGLLRVFLAFASACLSLPLLALIWGARVSDLQDVWLMLSEGVKLGETRFSFSDFLTFGLVFSIGYTITRMLQSGLRTAVLPKTNIDVGAQNALVTGLGYVGIFLAAAAAITSTGIDLSSLAIVAGALSVGIGFGLQNIVSNFVSGIILLIERPIRLGDWIDVGTTSGIVSKISVRSTIVETFDQSEVIVPNADFISGTVTNRTRNNKRGRIKVPVGVAYDSDPEQVKEILLSIADDNAALLKVPKPRVFLMGFGADSIDFEIRGILRDVDNIVSAHSDMNFEILHRFKQAGIEIPFGQREIRIKNADELSQALNPKPPKARKAK
jgi:small-conductance mechanosensitive channel